MIISQYRGRQPPLLLPPARVRARDKLPLPVEIRETKPRHAIIVEHRGMIENSFERAAAEAFGVLIREFRRVNGWPFMRECIAMCPAEASLVPDTKACWQAGFIYAGKLPALCDEVQLNSRQTGELKSDSQAAVIGKAARALYLAACASFTQTLF